MYKIIGGDGREYGPISAEQVRQWVREGRANSQTQVLRDGATEWQALGSVPELAEGLNVPPTIGALPPAGASGLASTGTPGAVLDGDYELDIFGCVSRAWDVFSANFGLMLGGCAIYLLIIGGMSGFAQIPFIGPLISIVSLIITGPLLGGVYYFLLRLLRRQPAEVGDVFAGFRDNMGQLILGNLIPTLIMCAMAVPGLIMIGVPTFLMVHKEAADAGLIAIAAIGLFLVLIPLMYFSICWAFTIPLIMDKRLDFWPAMKVSRRQVCRHWWTMFGLVVVIGLINMVGLFVCCVGMFFTMPLTFGALLLAYETLFSPRAAQPGAGA